MRKSAIAPPGIERQGWGALGSANGGPVAEDVEADEDLDVRHLAEVARLDQVRGSSGSRRCRGSYSPRPAPEPSRRRGDQSSSSWSKVTVAGFSRMTWAPASSAAIARG